MSLDSFVQSAYSKSYWTMEEALDTRRGFVAAVEQGWGNADGSQQSIVLVRFATPLGAMSAFNAASSGRVLVPKPVTMLSDPAIGAVGWSSPTLDSRGDAKVVLYAAVGDTMISVFEYTAATPDPADAKALVQRQYDSLKNGT